MPSPRTPTSLQWDPNAAPSSHRSPLSISGAGEAAEKLNGASPRRSGAWCPMPDRGLARGGELGAADNGAAPLP